MRDGERGQSEALGFVLVFAIIIISVVLVTATGYGGLQQVQESERTNNAVNAFEVLAGNVDELSRGAPTRGTEMTLAGAGLSFGDPVTVRVTLERVSDAETFTYEYDVQPIVYDPGTGSTLVYENGAVIRVDRDGMVMLREPRLRLDTDESVISVLQVQSPDTRAVGGQSTVVVRTKRVESVPINVTTVPYKVTLEIVDSPRAAAWYQYLKSTCPNTPTIPGGTATCEFTTDRAYATLVRVEATFE